MKALNFLIWFTFCAVGLGFPTNRLESSTLKRRILRFEPEKQAESTLSFIRNAPQYISDALSRPKTIVINAQTLPVLWRRATRAGKPTGDIKPKHKLPHAASSEEGNAWVMRNNSPFESYLLNVLAYASILAVIILICAPMLLSAPFMPLRAPRQTQIPMD